MAKKEAIQGKQLIYLYRLLKDAATKDGAAIAFTTENGRTKTKDADTTATKDGSIRTPGAMEQEITASSILTKGDELIEKLETALDNDELVEIWEVNIADEVGSGQHKYKGMYFQGYITEIEYSSNSDDMVEVSLTFGINGNGAKGTVTLTQEQETVAGYVFADVKKTGA